MNINRTIREAASKQASADSRALPSSSIKREASLNEREAEYKPQGYGIHICLHSKTYYEPCTSCRRSKADAKRNLSNL